MSAQHATALDEILTLRSRNAALERELRDWQDSSEAYRKDFEAERDRCSRLQSALSQAVKYADVVSMEDGMPEGKQAARLTAAWIGADQRYSAEFDVKAARSLSAPPSAVSPDAGKHGGER